jgi:hypothetical protein
VRKGLADVGTGRCVGATQSKSNAKLKSIFGVDGLGGLFRCVLSYLYLVQRMK